MSNGAPLPTAGEKHAPLRWSVRETSKAIRQACGAPNARKAPRKAPRQKCSADAVPDKTIAIAGVEIAGGKLAVATTRAMQSCCCKKRTYETGWLGSSAALFLARSKPSRAPKRGQHAATRGKLRIATEAPTPKRRPPSRAPDAAGGSLTETAAAIIATSIKSCALKMHSLPAAVNAAAANIKPNTSANTHDVTATTSGASTHKTRASRVADVEASKETKALSIVAEACTATSLPPVAGMSNRTERNAKRAERAKPSGGAKRRALANGAVAARARDAVSGVQAAKKRTTAISAGLVA
mmetsp:Transcript_33959/g.56161  ORF Transcript_33959/g.56161 Transcript_33959/m.56161 type:complete len:297 (+) Transcript_33959:418-1308(+)